MKTFTTRTAALAIMTLAATVVAGAAFAQTGGSMSGPATPASSGTMSGGSMASPAGGNTMSGGSMQSPNTKGKKKPAATGTTPGQSSGAMATPSQSSGSMGSTPH
jgi:hypothetical protein